MARKICQGHLLLASLLLIFFIGLDDKFASAEIFFKKGSPHVKLSNNALLSGKLDYSREGRPFNSFVGVPFGHIPERFEESQPAPAWDGIFNATKQGEICVQPLEISGKVQMFGSEDCLNLNVYVPMNNTGSKEGYPVMVMVHGGGFSSGHGFMIGPKFIMDEDVILVTMNYRLNVFGFLSTGDSVIPGNNGLKDQLLALKWVQDNIRNLGGDPKKVSLSGQSAGGASVHYLFLSPASNGLFQSAVAQSGSALLPWAYNPNPKATALRLATYLNCSGGAEEPSAEEIKSCLKELTPEQLNEAQFSFVSKWPPKYSVALDFVPVTEPKDSNPNSPFLTESPWNITQPLKTIPYITGTTEDEGVSLYSGVILGDETLLNELDAKWEDIILGTLHLDRFLPLEEQPKVAKKIRQFYFANERISTENRLNLTNMFSDAWFVHGIRKVALDIARHGEENPVYLYQFAHRGPASLMKLFGVPIADEEAKLVGHGNDILSLANMDNVLPPGLANLIAPDSPDEEFSKHYVKQLASIAKDGGKPSYVWGEEWEPISKDEAEEKSPLKWYKLDSTPGYMEEGDMNRGRAEFWENIYNEHVLKSV